MSTPTPRTKNEALFDARYGFRFNDMNATLYRRLDFMLSLVSLSGGAAVFGSAVGGSGTLGAFAGSAITLAGLLAHLIRPSEKAIEHTFAKKSYAELDATSHEMSLEAFDARLRRLQADAPTGIRALAQPAYNATAMSNGWHAHVQRLRVLERVANFFA